MFSSKYKGWGVSCSGNYTFKYPYELNINHDLFEPDKIANGQKLILNASMEDSRSPLSSVGKTRSFFLNISGDKNDNRTKFFTRPQQCLNI